MAYNIKLNDRFKTTDGTIYTVKSIGIDIVCSRVKKNGTKLSDKRLTAAQLFRLTIVR